MGNKRSRELSRPKDRGRDCTCDTFNLRVTFDRATLTIAVVTDLPLNTRVAVKAERLYREPDGHEMYWTTLDDAYPVGQFPDGTTGFELHRTVLELDTAGLNRFRSLKGRWPTGISSPPSDELEITARAPTTDHCFGLCNRRLTGKAVSIEPSGHYLERRTSILAPTAPEVIQQLGFATGS